MKGGIRLRGENRLSGQSSRALTLAFEAAAELGHSELREFGYLTVHSVLHLLGYDHVDEAEMKQQMRAREDAIMDALQIGREKT